MKITTIEQLKQRIGKFVVTSQHDPNCDDKDAMIKKITKIEHCHFFNGEHSNSPFYNLKIWGTCTAVKNPLKMIGYLNTETYCARVQYIRDPTKEELRKFLNMWRIAAYKHGNKI